MFSAAIFQNGGFEFTPQPANYDIIASYGILSVSFICVYIWRETFDLSF